MTKTRKPRKSYTKEFKLEAIRLMNSSEKPSSEIAVELGVRRNQLYKWKDQLETKGEESLTNRRGRPSKESQSEMRTLKQEVERLREENEILKKAAVYFAKELK